MSHHNHRRDKDKVRTENGPRWEGPNPGAGCNSTHVARARSKWAKRRNRAIRRTGRWPGWSGQPVQHDEDE